MITHGTFRRTLFEIRKTGRVESDWTPPFGLTVAQVAQAWGMSRDEAFSRLHGDEAAIEAPALFEDAASELGG